MAPYLSILFFFSCSLCPFHALFLCFPFQRVPKAAPGVKKITAVILVSAQMCLIMSRIDFYVLAL